MLRNIIIYGTDKKKQPGRKLKTLTHKISDIVAGASL